MHVQIWPKDISPFPTMHYQCAQHCISEIHRKHCVSMFTLEISKTPNVCHYVIMSWLWSVIKITWFRFLITRVTKLEAQFIRANVSFIVVAKECHPRPYSIMSRSHS